MTVLGTMELGIGVFRYNMMSDLAQEGSRWAAVRGAFTTEPATSTSLNTYLTGRALGIALTSVTMSCGASGAVLSPCDCDQGVGAVKCVAGNVVQVAVQSSFRPTALIPIGTITLQSTGQMTMPDHASVAGR